MTNVTPQPHYSDYEGNGTSVSNAQRLAATGYEFALYQVLGCDGVRYEAITSRTMAKKIKDEGLEYVLIGLAHTDGEDLGYLILGDNIKKAVEYLDKNKETLRVTRYLPAMITAEGGRV